MANLICFIASHVTKERLPQIAQLFDTIKNQTTFCSIFLSWSAQDDESKSNMKALLEENKVITGKYSDLKLSQFEHYTNLLTYAKENSYIMFSDDDDLWSVDRIDTMQKALDHYVEVKYKFSRIIFPDYAELYPNGNIKRKKYKNTKLDVDHWATIVPYFIVREFFTITSKWLIANRYCDVRFCNYIMRYKSNGIDQTGIVGNKYPLYIYRIRDDGMCEGAKKITHRHTGNLKGILDTRITNILIKILDVDFHTFINMLNINLEVGIVRTYPDTDSIKIWIIFLFLYWSY